MLLALGLSEEQAHQSIRFGLGRFTTREEVEFTSSAVLDAVREIARSSGGCSPFKRLQSKALVDFSDQITKIYRQGASMTQSTFEQHCGGRRTFEHRDEMRRDRIWGRS